MADKKQIAVGTLGVIGILSLLISGGYYLTDEQAKDTYVCELTEQVGIFERLSGSQKTGYFTENGSEEAERCNEGRTYGQWIQIQEYAEIHNVSIESLLNPPTPKAEPNKGKQYICNPRECIEVS